MSLLITGSAPVGGDAMPNRQARVRQPAVYTILYLAIITVPVVALFFETGPGRASFPWIFAMAIGRAALAMLAMQAVLTARFPRIALPFGADIIYYFHCWAAIAALALVALHYVILRAAFASALAPGHPLSAPAYMTAGRVSLMLFAAIVLTSLVRKQLRLRYERWRMLHALLSLAAISLAFAHLAGAQRAGPIWLHALWGAYGVLWVGAIGYIRIVRPWHLRRRPYHVAAVQAESAGAWTVTLRPTDPAAQPFQPGQFAWLSLGTSPFRGEEHPFSYSGSADRHDALHFTIKGLGDFTRTIGQMPVGTVAFVDGPYGIFTTDRYPDAGGFVFIAGGVGIAPIMSMLRTFADRHDRRPLHLIYGNWRPDDVLFRDELEGLARILDLSITYLLQEPPRGWSGERGLITHGILFRRLSIRALGYHFFLCGPRAMTDSVAGSLKKLGVLQKQIHFEHFEMV